MGPMLVLLLHSVSTTPTLVIDTPAATQTTDTPAKDEPSAPTLASCLVQEGLAAVGCCGSLGVIGFGVLTLGVSPVFASTPLPIGIVGIVLGVIGVAASLLTAVSAPAHLLAGEPAPEKAAPDVPDERTAIAY